MVLTSALSGPGCLLLLHYDKGLYPRVATFELWQYHYVRKILARWGIHYQRSCHRSAWCHWPTCVTAPTSHTSLKWMRPLGWRWRPWGPRWCWMLCPSSSQGRSEYPVSGTLLCHRLFVLSICTRVSDFSYSRDSYDLSRSWLLPVIRDHVSNTELAFFTSYFLPLADKLRAKCKLHRIFTKRSYRVPEGAT